MLKLIEKLDVSSRKAWQFNKKLSRLGIGIRLRCPRSGYVSHIDVASIPVLADSAPFGLV